MEPMQINSSFRVSKALGKKQIQIKVMNKQLIKDSVPKASKWQVQGLFKRDLPLQISMPKAIYYQSY